MLSVVSGNTGGCVAMERLRGGAPGPHRGERGISTGRGRHHNQLAVMVAAQRDRAVRLHSVHTDLELDLPPSIALPDGEDHPYGTSARLKLRDDEQESEIYQKCVRPPPNRTVFESESPPPYRSHSAGLLGSLTSTSSSTTSTNEYQPLVVRCHSLSSHPSSTTTTTSKSDFIQRTVKIFTGNKKQSTNTTTTTSTNSAVVPCVVVPKQHRTTSVQTSSSTSNKNQV